MPKKLPMTRISFNKYLRENAGKKKPIEMAREVGVSEYTIKDNIWRLGLSVEVEGEREKKQEFIDFIKKHGHEYNVMEIHKKFGVPHGTIRSTAWRNGVVLKSMDKRDRVRRRKHDIQPGLFNVNAIEYGTTWLI